MVLSEFLDMLFDLVHGVARPPTLHCILGILLRRAVGTSCGEVLDIYCLDEMCFVILLSCPVLGPSLLLVLPLSSSLHISI